MATPQIAVPMGTAPQVAPAQPMLMAAPGPQVVVVTNTVAPVKVSGGSKLLAVGSGVLMLLVVILAGIGAGGPWYSWQYDSKNFIWFAGWGVNVCFNPADLLSSLGLPASAASALPTALSICESSTELTVYQGVMGLAYGLQSPAAALALATTFTQTVFSQMRSGVGLLAIGCILAFVSMITSFVAACNGIKGCCGNTSNVLNIITLIFVVAGTAATGGAFGTLSTGSVLSGNPLIAGAPSALKNWGVGFGQGCAVASCVLTFIAVILTCVGVCKK